MHTQEDVILGRKLATGGFGTVYRGELLCRDGSKMPIIIKKVQGRGGMHTCTGCVLLQTQLHSMQPRAGIHRWMEAEQWDMR